MLVRVDRPRHETETSDNGLLAGRKKMKTHVPFRFHLFSQVFVPFQSELTGIDFYRPTEIGPSLDGVGEIPALRWLARRPDLMQLILGQLGLRGRVCLDVEVTEPVPASI